MLLRKSLPLLLLAPLLMRANINLVQHADTVSSAASVSLAYSSNVTKGDLLVVGIRWDAAGTSVTATVADSQGNTGPGASSGYYAAASALTNTGANYYGIYYALAGSSGADTVTLTLSSAVNSALNIRQYHATLAWLPNPLDNAPTGIYNTGCTAVSLSITTKYSHEAVYSFVTGTGSPTWTAGSGWGNVDTTSGSGQTHAAEDQINVGPGTYGSQGTWSTSTNCGCVVAGFYEGGLGFPQILQLFHTSLHAYLAHLLVPWAH